MNKETSILGDGGAWKLSTWEEGRNITHAFLPFQLVLQKCFNVFHISGVVTKDLSSILLEIRNMKQIFAPPTFSRSFAPPSTSAMRPRHSLEI